MINFGVIGYGYWGPNIVRNFNQVEGASVVAVCDTKPKALKRARKLYPNLIYTSDYQRITTSSDVDVVAIITPVSTHYMLAKEALQNGKHIFVEKPFTETVAQAEELIHLAEKKNLQIMVDHTFLFTGAVRKIKEIIDKDMLGKLYYYDSTRINLGLFQHDVNVIWDLAPHDFSIMDYLMKERPIGVAACGQSHVKNGLEDIAYITVYLTGDIIAHFNVNWLAPVKVRSTLIGGEKQMLLWNDVSADEKIKIYDKGININNEEGVYDRLISYRSGDMWAPKIDQIEALKLEAEHLVESLTNGKKSINDGYAGLRVVKMLEACNRSLNSNGKTIAL